MVLMQKTMRWYGPGDPVTLATIRQAGCSGVVTALHHVPVGEVWTVDEIRKRQEVIRRSGMEWSVVESLPVHDDIKRRADHYSKWITNYQESLRNLATCGIKVITYNFMPVLDWVRTDIAYAMPDGSEALRFEKTALAAFDMFLLQRPGAEAAYSSDEIAEATSYVTALSEDGKQALFSTVMMGLPGSQDTLERESLLGEIARYDGVTREDLRANLVAFLQDVVPTASECGVRLALHPDDPPFPVLGLPRVVSTDEDLSLILASVDEEANGLCFCTGSLGARRDNDVVAMMNRMLGRVHFLHLRSTRLEDAADFHEANHLEGDTDMYTVVERVVEHMQTTGRSIPMRPDHGHRMSRDLTRLYYPGYSEIGRLKGLAEVRGLEYAIARRLYA